MSKRKSKSKKKGGHGFGPASLNGQKKRKSKRKKKSRFLSFLSNAWPALAFVTFWAVVPFYCGGENEWERRVNSPNPWTYDEATQVLGIVESKRNYSPNDSFECIWDTDIPFGESGARKERLTLGFDAHGLLISSKVEYY